MATKKTESNDTGTTQETSNGGVSDWLRPEAAIERLQRYNDRVGEVSEEVLERSVAAVESLSRLTRDNLAAGRVVAKQWRDLGIETMRRHSELLTPSWMR
jgi:hypothetical protein